MPQIREIKKRTKSITNTAKVTHAMELVAVTKMKRSQQAALASRPYSINLDEILKEVKSKIERSTHPLLSQKEEHGQLIILVSSDRGLAGGLNINVFRELIHLQGEKSSHLGGDQMKFITVGKKGTNFIAKTGGEMIASFQSEEKSPIDLARTLSKMVIDNFSSGKVSKVSLLYPHFESTVKQTPKWIQLLPIGINSDQLPQTKDQTINNLLFEPNAAEILKVILPHYVLTQIYQVLLEAKASEHSARMVAMKNATDAANDLVDDLTLTYNQARQETITKELLDIITAQRAFE